MLVANQKTDIIKRVSKLLFPCWLSRESFTSNVAISASQNGDSSAETIAMLGTTAATATVVATKSCYSNERQGRLPLLLADIASASTAVAAVAATSSTATFVAARASSSEAPGFASPTTARRPNAIVATFAAATRWSSEVRMPKVSSALEVGSVVIQGQVAAHPPCQHLLRAHLSCYCFSPVPALGSGFRRYRSLDHPLFCLHCGCSGPLLGPQPRILSSDIGQRTLTFPLSAASSLLMKI